MAYITVYNEDGFEVTQFEVPDGKRLVLALEDAGIPILHRCGGYARCTTCRVEFVRGEPTRITLAEQTRLASDTQLQGVRLACQILCEGKMAVLPLIRTDNATIEDAGTRPLDTLTPDPEWKDLSDDEIDHEHAP